MYQAVVDTNVLLAALRSRRGASHLPLSLLGGRRWQMNQAVPLVPEYEDVVKGTDPGVGLGEAEVDDILDFICAESNLREIFYLWRPALPDPKDDFILELAVESGCDFIVTHNVRDFSGAAKFGIEAITPQEFLRKLGELT